MVPNQSQMVPKQSQNSLQQGLNVDSTVHYNFITSLTIWIRHNCNPFVPAKQYHSRHVMYERNLSGSVFLKKCTYVNLFNVAGKCHFSVHDCFLSDHIHNATITFTFFNVMYSFRFTSHTHMHMHTHQISARETIAIGNILIYFL